MRYRVNTVTAIWNIIDGEAVIVQAESTEYFGLNASATALWQVLATSQPSAERLAELLGDWYDRDPTAALLEANAFVAAVRDAGLVTEIAEGTHGATDTTPDGLPSPLRSGPYEAPTVVKFGDLDELILSGE